jgi:hypothetical protein
MIRYKIVAAKNRMGSIVKFSSGKIAPPFSSKAFTFTHREA